MTASGIEMSWLFMDVLLKEFPSPVRREFPHEMTSQGRLTPVRGVQLSDHLGRLTRSRAVFLQSFREMSLEDWNRFRIPPDDDYEVTPAWAVFHLVEHESGHAAQISALKTRAARLESLD